MTAITAMTIRRYNEMLESDNWRVDTGRRIVCRECCDFYGMGVSPRYVVYDIDYESRTSEQAEGSCWICQQVRPVYYPSYNVIPLEGVRLDNPAT